MGNIVFWRALRRLPRSPLRGRVRLRRDRLLRIEDVWGSTGPDILRGDANANLLLGDAGADRLLGGERPDHVEGGVGRDVGSEVQAVITCAPAAVQTCCLPVTVNGISWTERRGGTALVLTHESIGLSTSKGFAAPAGPGSYREAVSARSGCDVRSSAERIRTSPARQAHVGLEIPQGSEPQIRLLGL
jgi:hypothetical protein